MKIISAILIVAGVLMVLSSGAILTRAGHLGTPYRFALQHELVEAMQLKDEAAQRKIENARAEFEAHANALIYSQVNCALTVGIAGCVQGVAGLVSLYIARKRQPNKTPHPAPL